MPLLSRSILMIGLLTGVVSVGLADPYTFISLNDPHTMTTTGASGINSAGQVVGTYFNANGNGFLYSGGIFTTIDDPAGFSTTVSGINDSGQIVGYYFDSNFVTHGFVYSGGTFTNTDPVLPTGINNAGQIVGTVGLGPAALYSGGTLTTFNDPLAVSSGTFPAGINNSGQIVGFYLDANGGMHGFLFSGGTFTTIDDPLTVEVGLGCGGSRAGAINDAGQIVGYYCDAGKISHGFLYSGGTFTTIDDPLGTSGSAANGINNAGQIVGGYLDANRVGHGFIATPSASITISVVVNVDTDLNSATQPPATFNIDSEGAMHVAILGSTGYDVTTIDPTTVKFGPKGAPNVGTAFFQDVNADGKPDLILSFVPRDAGFGCFDMSAILTGQTYSKQPFSGSEMVHTTHTLPVPLGVCPP